MTVRLKDFESKNEVIVCEDCGCRLDSDGTFCPSCNECVNGKEIISINYDSKLRNKLLAELRRLRKELIKYKKICGGEIPSVHSCIDLNIMQGVIDFITALIEPTEEELK